MAQGLEAELTTVAVMVVAPERGRSSGELTASRGHYGHCGHLSDVLCLVTSGGAAPKVVPCSSCSDTL